jgi:hypothetical protein
VRTEYRLPASVRVTAAARCAPPKPACSQPNRASHALVCVRRSAKGLSSLWLPPDGSIRQCVRPS